jgi:hypothetical protein
MRVVLTLAGLIAVGLASQPAEACTCPKEQLIKRYGSVSALGPAAAPRPGPLAEPAPAAPAEALPLLWPIAEKSLPASGLPEWGLADPAIDPFMIRLPVP